MKTDFSHNSGEIDSLSDPVTRPPSPYQPRDRWGRVHSDGHRAPDTGAGYHRLCGRCRVRCLFIYDGDAVLGAGRWAHGHGGHSGNKVPLGGLENKERKIPKTKGAWAITGLGRDLINESWVSGGAPMSAFGGRADLYYCPVKGPLIAISGNSMRRFFGQLSTREFKRLYGHVWMWVLGDEGVGFVREAGHDGRSMT